MLPNPGSGRPSGRKRSVTSRTSTASTSNDGSERADHVDPRVCVEHPFVPDEIDAGPRFAADHRAHADHRVMTRKLVHWTGGCKSADPAPVGASRPRGDPHQRRRTAQGLQPRADLDEARPRHRNLAHVADALKGNRLSQFEAGAESGSRRTRRASSASSYVPLSGVPSPRDQSARPSAKSGGIRSRCDGA